MTDPWQPHQKVNDTHLRRDAYLYVRQSSPRQLIDHQESTQRQYALRQKAIALGWRVEQIVVIDCDLGQSASPAAPPREGFARLVAEVGMGKAGLVLGLEASRLARKSSDWHRLLEICALTGTLLLDEDGLYDPAHFNDRLLLGMKGNMSEAEAHLIKARLLGGVWHKAKRGELPVTLPTGLVYHEAGHPILDPDQQVQASFQALFATFQRTGSATATVKAFRRQGLLFPRRLREGIGKGELRWGPLSHSRCLGVLHNPRYAGAFVYGRSRLVHTLDGHRVEHTPPERWILLTGRHAGYIPWEQYESNQKRLRENARGQGLERRFAPPRQGPALLQGIILCGRCGTRMAVRYHCRQRATVPDYLCQQHSIEHAEPLCQQVSGWTIDAAIGELLVRAMTPLALELTMAVQQELQARWEEVDRLRSQQVERARYEADLAHRRYLQVDPANRLVAASLEADWDRKLRALGQAQQECEQLRRRDRLVADETQRKRIAELANEFPRLWADPQIADREKKRMVRLLIEDVTVDQNPVDRQILVQVRFRSGATQTLTLPRPPNAAELRKTQQAVVAEIDQLLNTNTDREIAALLNAKGLPSGGGAPFTSVSVRHLRTDYGLRSLFQRLREKGLLTRSEMAKRLGIRKALVVVWGKRGLLKGQRYDDKGQCLYEPPPQELPEKFQWKKPYLRAKAESVPSGERGAE